MTRRESLRALISGGAAYRERPANKGKREHHQDTRLFHGRITLPQEILDSLGRAPVVRTMCKHPALRTQRDGVTYLLRTAICGPHYVGEVVRTQAGAYRVHAWSVADCGRPVAEVIERDREQLIPPVPPLSALPEPEPNQAEYGHYFDPPPDYMPRKLEILQD